MSTVSRIDSDLSALAESTTRGLPTIEQTARALAEARARPKRGVIMSVIRKPIWATALGAVAVAGVLLFPVPYRRVVGYDLTIGGAAGRVAHVRLGTRNAAVAERRAAELRRSGATVTVAPRSERVWGRVYAMAKEKLLDIHLDLDGKSDAEVADELRGQLEAAGWTPDDVQVQLGDDQTRVRFSADDGAGRKTVVVREAKGGKERKMDLEVGGIDDTREPGMTDAQLRDKILKQLEARGLKGEVTVEGKRIEIRAERTKEEEEDQP